MSIIANIHPDAVDAAPHGKSAALPTGAIHGTSEKWKLNQTSQLAPVDSAAA